MATDITLPPLGENIDSGQVVSLLVATGDVVDVDQPLLEVETDKAAIEIPTDTAGTVVQLLVKEGDTATVGQVIAQIEAEDGAATTDAAPEPVANAVEQTTADATVAAEPATVAPPPAPTISAAPPVVPPALGPAVAASRVAAAPSVRRFAREIGIDITAVPGSGPGGRISVDDVKAYSRATRTALPTAVAGAVEAQPLPDFSRWGDVDVTPMGNLRQAAAKHLSHAWTTVPHVTQFDVADITDLEAQRKRFAPVAAAGGGKLTITAILMKVLASALKRFPQFNASVDMAAGTIIYKQYYHIGIAVDTDRGLIVPVVRDVDQKNIVELAADLAALSERARTRKTAIDEMQGGTFTLSNLGGIGGTAFTPIVNWPEVAILGVARARTEPVWRDGEFVPRLMLQLALSYDHRVIDGADGARFLRWVAEALESPFLLALEG